MIKDTKFEIDYQRVLITMNLLGAVEDSDYTQQHSLRVGRLVKLVAQELGLDLKTANLVTRASYYHDVGKIKISKDILFKSGKLTEGERKIIQRHPKDGADILRSLGMNSEADIVEQHHEKLNGNGYPLGLKGSDFNGLSQILAIVDVYDAMIADRPYRKGFESKSVLVHMYSRAGKEYELFILQALHKVLEKEGVLKKTLDI
jgi:putative nucleotidyltransferase with HDIG domain